MILCTECTVYSKKGTSVPGLRCKGAYCRFEILDLWILGSVYDIYYNTSPDLSFIFY